ncbi:NIL domain-containing protein [Desulfocurvus sp. DL9XJH121]
MQDVIKAQRKIVYLKFPPERSGRPVMCNLTRLFDLTFNILQAHILPRGEGRMTLELTGTEDNYRKGVNYLKEQGIRVEHVAQKIFRDEDSCIDCGVCTALCRSQALHVHPVTRKVEFDSEKCTACGMCTRVCPVNAMVVQLEEND